MARSVRYNFSWTLVGQVVYGLCQWAVLAVLARALNEASVGAFALGLTVAATVTAFTNLQLRAVQATDARGEYRFSEYLALRLVMSVVTLLVVAVVVQGAGIGQSASMVVAWITIARVLDMVGDAFYGLLQRHQRMDLIARSLVLNGVLTLGFVVAVCAVSERTVLAAFASAVASGLTLVAWTVPAVVRLRRSSAIGESLRPVWNGDRLGTLAWSTVPLGLVMLLLGLGSAIPRLFIERELGLADLGVFSALAYPALFGFTLVNALGQALSPSLAAEYAAGNVALFRGLLVKGLQFGGAIGVAGVILSLAAGRMLIQIVYGPGYRGYGDTLIVLMVANAVSYLGVFLGVALVVLRRFWTPLVANAATVAVVAGLCYLLVERAGIIGAAFAVLGGTIAGTLVAGSTVWFIVRRFQP